MKDLKNIVTLNFKMQAHVFLIWYFHEGQDTEKRELRESLAELVIDKLSNYPKVATVTVEDVFKNCNQASIPLRCLEGIDVVEAYDNDLTVADLDYDCNVTLI